MLKPAKKSSRTSQNAKTLNLRNRTIYKNKTNKIKIIVSFYSYTKFSTETVFPATMYSRVVPGHTDSGLPELPVWYQLLQYFFVQTDSSILDSQDLSQFWTLASFGKQIWAFFAAAFFSTRRSSSICASRITRSANYCIISLPIMMMTEEFPRSVIGPSK